jgi:hypothetical protein
MSLSDYGRPTSPSRQFALQIYTYQGGSMPILQPPRLADPLPPYRGGREAGKGGRGGRRGGRGRGGVGGGRGRPEAGAGRRISRWEEVARLRPFGRFFKAAGRQ